MRETVHTRTPARTQIIHLRLYETFRVLDVGSMVPVMRPPVISLDRNESGLYQIITFWTDDAWPARADTAVPLFIAFPQEFMFCCRMDSRTERRTPLDSVSTS